MASTVVRARARGSTHQGGAGELEVQGRSELLGEAEGLKGASGDRAEELASIGRLL